MEILSKLFIAIARLLELLIFIRVLIEIVASYNNLSYRKNNFGGFFFDITEPFLKPFRNIMPPASFMDISPLLAIAMIDVSLIFSLLILKRVEILIN